MRQKRFRNQTEMNVNLVNSLEYKTPSSYITTFYEPTPLQLCPTIRSFTRNNFNKF